MKRAAEPEFRDHCALILAECRQALEHIDAGAVERFIDALESADRIFFVGVGRVLLSLEAMAKRLAHLGLECVIVGQITEPAITAKDLLVVGSGSGESLFPAAIAGKARGFGATVVHIGSNAESRLKPITDIFIRIPVRTRLSRPDEIDSHQPMTSLFEQSLLLFGDAVAGMIVARRQIDLKSLWRYHANLE